MIRFVCLCIGILPFINSTPEHQFQSNEIIETIDVPVHYSEHRHKRDLQPGSNHEMLFYAFGKNFSLYFEEDDHVLMGSNTPIMAAYSDSQKARGVGYKIIPDVMSKLEMKALHDIPNDAVAVEYKDNDGTRRLMGLINDYDMPLKWSLLRPRGDIQPTLRVSRLVSDAYRFSNLGEGWNYIANPRAPTYNPWKPTTRRPTPKVPETVYPEILVLLDYLTYKALNEDPIEVAKYVLALWTAVDLRYRSLEHPKVRLNVAGIVIATDQNAAPYSKYVNKNLDNILGPLAVHLYREKWNLPKYDAAVHLIHRPVKTINEQRYVAGIAYHRGICTNAAVATTLDDGNFGRIGTIAHELGHLFGAYDEIKGQEHRKQCLDDNQVFIMGYSDSRDTENKVGMHFSNCSLAVMQRFLSSPNARCLYNTPTVGKQTPKVLPHLTLAEQCTKKYGPTYVHFNTGQSACENLYCCDGRVCRWTNEPAAEGTSCQRGKICLNGKCVLRPEELSHVEDNFEYPKDPIRPSRPNNWNPARPAGGLGANWWPDIFNFNFS